MSDRQTMDTSVTAESPTPPGFSVSNGTPGKAQGYAVANAPFQGVGIDSGDQSANAWPPDQLNGHRPGHGSTQNNPNA